MYDFIPLVRGLDVIETSKRSGSTVHWLSSMVSRSLLLARDRCTYTVAEDIPKIEATS